LKDQQLMLLRLLNQIYSCVSPLKIEIDTSMKVYSKLKVKHSKGFNAF